METVEEEHSSWELSEHSACGQGFVGGGEWCCQNALINANRLRVTSKLRLPLYRTTTQVWS